MPLGRRSPLACKVTTPMAPRCLCRRGAPITRRAERLYWHVALPGSSAGGCDARLRAPLWARRSRRRRPHKMPVVWWLYDRNQRQRLDLGRIVQSTAELATVLIHLQAHQRQQSPLSSRLQHPYPPVEHHRLPRVSSDEVLGAGLDRWSTTTSTQDHELRHPRRKVIQGPPRIIRG
jgi:hypothetical protein